MVRTALVVALLGTTAAPALAATLEVGQGRQYRSIQDAVNAAAPGDTVMVYRGVYQESVYNRGKPVKLISADGRGAARVISPGDGIALLGSGNVVRGFAVEARGDGIQVGGSPGNPAVGSVVEGNDILTAGLDGIKAHQARGLQVVGNTVRRSGIRQGNEDGGVDFVAVEEGEVRGNAVLHSAGNTCMMLKLGSSGNRVTGNSFTGCKDAVHVGGVGDAKFAAHGWNGRQAFNNTITGNRLCGGQTAFYLFGGERERRDNRIDGNQTDGCATTPEAAAAVVGGTSAAGSGYAGGGDAGATWDGAGSYNSSTARSLQGLAQGGCAASNAIGNVSAGIGTILGAGGRATAALQVAQQIQLLAQRVCQQQMLLAQLRMLTGMDLRTFDDVLSALRQVDGMLSRVGIDVDLSPDNIIRTLEGAYPDAFPDGTGYEAMEQQQIVWNDRVRDTLDGKTRIEHQVMANRQAAMERAGRLEQAGRDSEGIRGAQLATNGLLTELMGAVNDQIAVTTAHQRALAEVQYRQEAARAAAERDTADFMAPLAEECARCGKIPLNLFGGPNPSAVARSTGRTTNQVFGTGIQ